MEIKVITHEAPWADHIEFVVRSEDRYGVSYLGSSNVWEKQEPNTSVEENKIWRMPHDEVITFLNAFAEAAWKKGWRPDGHKIEDTSAMKAHLEDMRRLVFKNKT